MKILYVTTIGGTMPFFKTFIKELIDTGHTVDLACNEIDMPVPDYFREWGCKVHQISCSRSPLNKSSLTAIKEIRVLVESNKYDIVHCHTPVAAMCTRLACRKVRKNGTKVIYTAHGFHFCKGAPLLNWLIYYPVEKLCSCFTDVLITINQEDFALAKKKMKAKKVEYVPGVGIDLSRFQNVQVDRSAKRKEIGVPEDATLLLSVGELNENKNHEVIIRAIAQLNNFNIHYAIAGKGDKESHLSELAGALGVAEQVHLLGYRTDIVELNYSADIFCFPSFREGLGLGALEGMACGLPIITSNVHGINDYSIDGVTGYKCSPIDVNGFASAIQNCISGKLDLSAIGKGNKEIVKKYEVSRINDIMKEIYKCI